MTTPAIARFLAQVDKGDSGECWIWHGGRNGSYGAFHPATGTTELAHRYSYQTFVGPIPSGLNVNHLCDVPLCVNPAHLWTGSQRDNVHDCRAKGRHDRKLTIEQVTEARQMSKEKAVPYTELARRYGVTPGCVRHACIQRTWGHV
jgi:hypothetical protein